MATITVQTPRHAKSGLQCRWNAKPPREHTILHRSGSTNRTRKTDDEILFDESRPPEHHFGLPLVRSLTTEDRLGEVMDGLRPITSGVEDFEL